MGRNGQFCAERKCTTGYAGHWGSGVCTRENGFSFNITFCSCTIPFPLAILLATCYRCLLVVTIHLECCLGLSVHWWYCLLHQCFHTT
ncbi:hypothetical protein EV361DRAFT_903764 [Lentinula raphanica]|nr:hypothetical protein EV361DRAFT_903764 [Lentinula raphanica]